MIASDRGLFGHQFMCNINMCDSDANLVSIYCTFSILAVSLVTFVIVY
jgi:hypothetical protein